MNETNISDVLKGGKKYKEHKTELGKKSFGPKKQQKLCNETAQLQTDVKIEDYYFLLQQAQLIRSILPDVPFSFPCVHEM